MNDPKKAGKAGRPLLPPGEAKSVMLRVRLTPEERDSIVATARANAVTPTEWIRTAIGAALDEEAFVRATTHGHHDCKR